MSACGTKYERQPRNERKGLAQVGWKGKWVGAAYVAPWGLCTLDFVLLVLAAMVMFSNSYGLNSLAISRPSPPPPPPPFFFFPPLLDL